MIVVQQANGTWRVVYQPDHAAVSGQLAQRWRRPTAIPAEVWPRFVEAVWRHDEGWREAEQRPAVDAQGRPHNFKTLPTAEHMAVWRAGITQLAADDAYAGLIVALHARWLYTQFAGPNHDPAAGQAALAELNQHVDAAIRRLERGDAAVQAAVAPASLDVARRLLTLLDGLSLMLVGGLPVQGMPEPVAFDAAISPITVAAIGGEEEVPEERSSAIRGLRLEPWPFAGGGFEVEATVRWIAQRRYADALDLAAALQAAPPRTLSYRIEAEASGF